MMIDVGPMRRDIVRQFVPEGQWEKLSEQERQRVMAEVNQRMLGHRAGYPARHRRSAEATWPKRKRVAQAAAAAAKIASAKRP